MLALHATRPTRLAFASGREAMASPPAFLTPAGLAASSIGALVFFSRWADEGNNAPAGVGAPWASGATSGCRCSLGRVTPSPPALSFPFTWKKRGWTQALNKTTQP